MKRLAPLLGLVVIACCGAVHAGFESPSFDDDPGLASSFYLGVSTILPIFTTVDPPEGSEVSDATSEETISTSQDYRRLLAAREDAACFVASGGTYRSVRLEAALRWLRARPQSAGFDDLQLAAAILQR